MSETETPKKGKKWGIMVYMAADNNLSQDAIQGIGGIRRLLEQHRADLKDTEFFLYFDGNAFGFPSLQFDFSEPISTSNPIRFNREFRSSPESICSFVKKCAKKEGFKEIENFALIVSSHGFGFQEDSLLRDDSSRTSATVQDLADNIGKLNSEFLDRKLKILGFDSCVMNMLEVANELRRSLGGSGDDLKDVFLVSSEGYVPNAGWSYSRILEGLTRIEPKAPREMAELLVKSYIAEYEPSYEYSGLAIDISAFSLGLVDQLTEGVNAVGRGLLSLLKTEGIKRRVEKILLDSHSRSQTYLYDQSVDIKDFCDLLQKELSEDKVIDEESDLNKTLIKMSEAFCPNVYCKTLGTENQFSNGMSLYFPWSFDTFLIILPRYRQLEFGRKPEDVESLSDWGEFLFYYLFQTMRAPDRCGSRTDDPVSERQNGLSNLAGDDRKNQETMMKLNTKHTVNGEFGEGLDRSRINPPDKSRINPPDKTRLGSAFVENFRRTRNIAWLPEPAFMRLTGKLTKKEKTMARGSG